MARMTRESGIVPAAPCRIDGADNKREAELYHTISMSETCRIGWRGIVPAVPCRINGTDNKREAE